MCNHRSFVEPRGGWQSGCGTCRSLRWKPIRIAGGKAVTMNCRPTRFSIFILLMSALYCNNSSDSESASVTSTNVVCAESAHRTKRHGRTVLSAVRIESTALRQSRGIDARVLAREWFPSAVAQTVRIHERLSYFVAAGGNSSIARSRISP